MINALGHDVFLVAADLYQASGKPVAIHDAGLGRYRLYLPGEQTEGAHVLTWPDENARPTEAPSLVEKPRARVEHRRLWRSNNFGRPTGGDT